MSPHNSGGIQERTSAGSFLLSASTGPSVPQTKKKNWPPEDEIIPDSEEERINEEKARNDHVSTEEHSDEFELSPTKRPRLAERSVIVISSDSEDVVVPPKARARKPPFDLEDPFVDEDSGSGKGATKRRKPRSAIPKPLSTDKGKGKARMPLPRVESEDDSDVVCISDTDPTQEVPGPSASPVKQKIFQRTLTPYAPSLPDPDPEIEMDANSDDSAILTFDPHVRAKPVTLTPAAKSKTPARTKRGAPDPTPGPASTPANPAASKSPRKRKAVSQEQLQREAYARTLYNELNAKVFNGGMPAGTELVWNVRLQSTAGRANWSRNRHGVVSSKIELSSKVVDCDERVRLTLAHEMCHLAVWAVDGATNDQGHGAQFKAWASRVTKARPDITINTKHTYEINYKFTWECVECGKVYGRHSDSINIEQSACGVCNPPGRLKPLFEKRKRMAAATAGKSKLASGSPRESPRSLDRPLRSPAKSPTKSRTTLATPVPQRPGPNSDLTDEDDEVEELIKELGRVGI